MGEDFVLHLLPDPCSLNLATTAVPVGCSSKRYHSRHPRSWALPKLTIVNVEVKEYLVICQILQSQSERCLAGEGMSESDVQTWRLGKKSAKQESNCTVWNISQGFWREQRGTADWPCCRESSLLLKVPVPFSVALKIHRNNFLMARDKKHINTSILSEVGSRDLMCQCCMGSGACLPFCKGPASSMCSLLPLKVSTGLWWPW